MLFKVFIKLKTGEVCHLWCYETSTGHCRKGDLSFCHQQCINVVRYFLSHVGRLAYCIPQSGCLQICTGHFPEFSAVATLAEESGSWKSIHLDSKTPRLVTTMLSIMRTVWYWLNPDSEGIPWIAFNFIVFNECCDSIIKLQHQKSLTFSNVVYYFIFPSSIPSKKKNPKNKKRK